MCAEFFIWRSLVTSMADFRLLLPDDRGIIGTLDERGILTFVVLAGEGSPIRGTEMFDLMMRGYGEKVQAIRGVWRRGFSGRPSINLDKVNELTAAGMALTDAIKETWTATRAQRWGFVKVTLQNHPEGNPGAYSKIDVLIER
jgi:hypothetical protein